MAHLETDATGKQSGFQLLGILLLLREITTKLVRPWARFNSRIHGLKCTEERKSVIFLGLVDRGGGSCDTSCFSSLGVLVAILLYCIGSFSSSIGRVLKHVRTQKDPFVENSSRTGRTTGARIRDATAPRYKKRDIDGRRKVFPSRACRQMRRRRPL
jgi:hypothetical protein